MEFTRRSVPSGPPASDVRGRSGGVGRSTSPAAEQVSDHLRRHTSDLLRRRRRVAALSLAASGAMGVVSAYQMGLLRHVPEPPLSLLDADRVDASGEAYRFFHTPDAALGLASYATTLVLAGMGQDPRVEDRPWIPLALAGKVLADALGGVFLTLEQATKHRRFCSWCLLAAAASLAMLPQVIPETRLALRRLLARS